MSKEKVYLIDGTSICYRSFFAIKLSTSEGFPTGAIYGFYQTLRKLISEHSPKYMAICFDVSRKTFRQEKFKEYKVQRPPLPDGLKAQIPLIKEMIGFMGVKLVEKEGFEAEDVILTLSQKALNKDFSVVVVSSDKDLYQLIEDNRVILYNPGQERFIKEDDFKKEFGFGPPQMVDFLAITGDSVDNVPGAKGIGKVGASKLIKEFGTVENVFTNLNKISGRTKEILKDQKDNVVLSKELVKLEPCDVTLDLEELKIAKPDSSSLYKMFRELEFKKILQELNAPSSDISFEVKELTSLKMLEKLKKEGLILTVEGDFVYILGEDKKCILKAKCKEIKGIIEDDNVKKVSHEFKAQLHTLFPLVLKGVWFDVAVAGYLLDPSMGDYSLEALCAKYLDQYLSKIEASQKPFFIWKLYEILLKKIKEEGLQKLFSDVEMPLIAVLWEMENFGIRIDIKMMKKLLQQVEKRLEQLKKEIYQIAKKEFNLNSPQQLRVVLFVELKIPPLKKTKTGYSTSEEVLEKLADKYPITKLILEYRELNKLSTTYIVPLIVQVEKAGGKLHANFNQTVTQTGRLSSSSPNLQSIPAKGEFSAVLRSAFISSFEDGFMLSGDYSQIELRILAHFSDDERLKEAFGVERDIHRYTGSLLFGIEEAEIDYPRRDIAKRVNFAILYGMSPFGLSKELKVSTEEAERFIVEYFARYPKVKVFIDKINEQARKNGFVRTVLGRKRYLPDFSSPQMQLREFARRQAINTPIQGSCADLIKVAMVNIHRELKKRELKAKMIIQIHDELVFDVPKEELKEVKDIVKLCMEQSLELTVPIKVNIKYGKNWADMQELKNEK
ncbi:MAG: DNA polymerase I [Candidatus Omnitrophota bacterium]|nr:MAG: DNA polymerase I [Candidatus Omnitrophota bacterium]